MIIRPATIEEIDNWWNKRIAKNPENNAWVIWKDNFVNEKRQQLSCLF